MKIIVAQKTLEDASEVLARIRRELKVEPIVKDILKEKKYPSEILDGIPIKFSDDLDVSAKTVNSEIELNKKLLSEPFEIIMRYVVHELVHAFQHMDKEGKKDNNKAKDYLDNPDEVEAFSTQVAYDAKERGEDAAIEYVEDLIEYHEIPEGDKVQKKEELTEKMKTENIS